jgi:hypothetical protein
LKEKCKEEGLSKASIDSNLFGSSKRERVDVTNEINNEDLMLRNG